MHHHLFYSSAPYPLIFLAVGVLLLLLGRRLFWLFVGAAGFVLGIEAAPYLLPHQPELFTLIVAVILGIFGAILALFVQKLAIAIGGFLAGGYVAAVVCGPLLGGTAQAGEWICFLVGGILGAILMIAFFNWALIILSSVQGAHMITRVITSPRRTTGHGFNLDTVPHHFSILFVLLAVIGIVVQVATYRRRKEPA